MSLSSVSSPANSYCAVKLAGRLYVDFAAFDEDRSVEAAIGSTLAAGQWGDASGAIVHVAGGISLTEDEVVAVRDYLTAQLGRSPHVVIGANVDPALEHNLRITSILVGVENFVQSPPGALGRLVELDPDRKDLTPREAVSFARDA